jgi:flagellar FliJ protein
MSNALTILVNLAKDKVEESSKTLASTRNQLQASIDKLTMLKEYSEQYRQGVSNSVHGGISGDQLRHRYVFVDRIEDAIKQQIEDVTNKEQLVNLALSQWQSHQAEEKKFQTLIDRAETAKAKKEAKREQKNNDEYAARIHRVANGG